MANFVHVSTKDGLSRRCERPIQATEAAGERRAMPRARAAVAAFSLQEADGRPSSLDTDRCRTTSRLTGSHSVLKVQDPTWNPDASRALAQLENTADPDGQTCLDVRRVPRLRCSRQHVDPASPQLSAKRSVLVAEEPSVVNYEQHGAHRGAVA
jgi:hypothetical protein